MQNCHPVGYTQVVICSLMIKMLKCQCLSLTITIRNLHCSFIADYKRLDSAHLVPEAVNASIAMYRSINEGQDI